MYWAKAAKDHGAYKTRCFDWVRPYYLTIGV